MAGVTVFLAVGANLGDRQANIEGALQRLAAVPGIEVRRVSRWIETEPVDAPAGSPAFLNGVVEIGCSLSPAALLGVCKRLEADAGRPADGPRNAPRPLDLDILLFGDQRIDTRELQVPHPRMTERRFVMEPLAELTEVDALVAAPRPQVIREPMALAQWCSERLAGHCSIGLVPTMGALHAGHASLLHLARPECDRVVATVFVNPLQFAAGEDLSEYPRTFAADLEVMRAAGVDAVFAPAADAMYADGFCSTIAVGQEAATMEGATRPSHFTGVTTVVAKLFNLVRPARAYFGQKDAQQVAVIRRMVADLSYPLELRIGPIVRDHDGLALSSRNRYLADADRQAAPVLIRALRTARDRFRAGERDRGRLLAAARAVVEAEPRARLDYLELRHPDDLSPLPAGPVAAGRLLVAAFFGEQPAGGQVVRLLDNLALTEDD